MLFLADPAQALPDLVDAMPKRLAAGDFLGGHQVGVVDQDQVGDKVVLIFPFGKVRRHVLGSQRPAGKGRQLKPPLVAVKEGRAADRQPAVERLALGSWSTRPSRPDLIGRAVARGIVGITLIALSSCRSLHIACDHLLIKGVFTAP